MTNGIDTIEKPCISLVGGGWSSSHNFIFLLLALTQTNVSSDQISYRKQAEDNMQNILFSFLFLTYLGQAAVAQNPDDELAIRVLLNKGIEEDKLEYHCSAPERVFLEQAVNMGADKTMGTRRRGRRNLGSKDCRRLCRNIAPGYCYLRSASCYGYRRNLVSSFSDTFDFGSVPSFPTFTSISDFFGYGGSDDPIPDWVEESDLMQELDTADFSDVMADFGLEEDSGIPGELMTTVGGTCDTEIATTEALLFKLLENDLSMQCLALLKQEIKFDCIVLN